LRTATPDAARKLVALMESSSDKIALEAARIILDRVNGRPFTSGDLTIDTGAEIVIKWEE
jgi:hypothetical protein